MLGELPVSDTQKQSWRNAWRTALIFAASAWCFYWWGFVAGGKFTNGTEVRSLEQRLRVWDAVAREHPTEAASVHALADLEKARVTDLKAMVDYSITYRILAPIFAPYFTFELSRLQIASPTAAR
jgi:hypothetical protein